MEKFKKLYFELQNELDKLDAYRKNWSYFAVKRENFLKEVANHQLKVDEDLECDCENMEENSVFRAPLRRW